MAGNFLVGLLDDDPPRGRVGYEEDIVGTDEIIGADVAIGELLEDAANDMVSGDTEKALTKLAIARKAVPGAVGVFARKLKNRRRQPLAFTIGSLSPSGTVTVTAQPQQLMRPKRLVVPSSFAADVLIQDVKIANRSQFVGASDAVAGAVFSELAVGTGIDFLTANVGNQCAVVIQGLTTTTTVSVTATLIGVVAEP